MATKVNSNQINSKSQESKVDQSKNLKESKDIKDIKDIKEFKENKDGNMNEITEEVNNIANTNHDDFNFDNNIDEDYLNDDVKEVRFYNTLRVIMSNKCAIL